MFSSPAVICRCAAPERYAAADCGYVMICNFLGQCFTISRNSKLPTTTPLTSAQHGVIDLHGIKIVYGAHPLSAFTHNPAIQKYTVDIDISEHEFTGIMWANVSALYNQGSPVVTLETVNTTRLSLISDVSIGGAQAMWVVIGASS